jgi:hypothetical protein
MNDGDAVGHPYFDAATSSPFKDHYNGFGNATRFYRGANSFDERTGCSWSIPPPASRTRPDHVRRIDEKHYPSLADPVFRCRPSDVSTTMSDYSMSSLRQGAAFAAKHDQWHRAACRRWPRA